MAVHANDAKGGSLMIEAQGGQCLVISGDEVRLCTAVWELFFGGRTGTEQGRLNYKSKAGKDFASAYVQRCGRTAGRAERRLCWKSEGELKERRTIARLKFKLPLRAALWWPFVTHARMPVHARDKIQLHSRRFNPIKFYSLPSEFRTPAAGTGRKRRV